MLPLDFDSTDPEENSAPIVTIVTEQQLPQRRRIPRERNKTVDLTVASNFPKRANEEGQGHVDRRNSVCLFPNKCKYCILPIVPLSSHLITCQT